MEQKQISLDSEQLQKLDDFLQNCQRSFEEILDQKREQENTISFYLENQEHGVQEQREGCVIKKIDHKVFQEFDQGNDLIF